LRLEGAWPTTEQPLASIEATSDSGAVVHGHREVFADDLNAGGAWTAIDLDFGLLEMVMGFDVRVLSHDDAPIGAQMMLGLSRPGDATCTHGSPDAHTPEPRTVEIIRMLSRRAAMKARQPLSWRVR
jgi:hypothetical protein